ncbi:type 1 glutamine amidotransferase domain-containing protein [Pseudoalteromonas sp. SMS1]|uniref:type 1 glutamine amidotransferase domain-containing protein n=1 Tax=Pseudoalteromonas sp. SMS1 TaxID=2908894 RepID=UPI001F3A2A6F|nr:type 1 glutamine amidotransferase domain-containing protein [Pseudoalteromonas sp. SMS1]MCF2857690.1 type 1 glutamine amidotransferase domain-containing protein [Pseudoalteromonas sp. SMS1]
MNKLIATICMSFLSSAATAKDSPRVLMVLSSYGKLDSEQNLVQPGFEFGELSKAYHVFKRHGIEVTIASPNGGKPIADEYDQSTQYNQQFLQDPAAVEALENTRKLSTIKSSQFDGVFVVGGKGPMFDLYKHLPLQNIIAQIYDNKGVVGAVCHGPAALVDVQLRDGRYLVSGKRVNGFTNQEEWAFGKKWRDQFAFLLEDKLKARGAIFEQDGLMLNQVTIDGNLVTGQNPFSTVDTARAMVTQLGLETLPINEYQDDASVKLYELFLRDSALAQKTYEENSERYDLNMLAMMSVLQIRHAQTEYQVESSARFLSYILTKTSHPVMELTLAKAYVRLNQPKKAMNQLKQSAKKYPKNQQIKSFIASL